MFSKKNLLNIVSSVLTRHPDVSQHETCARSCSWLLHVFGVSETGEMTTGRLMLQATFDKHVAAFYLEELRFYSLIATLAALCIGFYKCASFQLCLTSLSFSGLLWFRAGPQQRTFSDD